jgi:hypothetical protein
VSVQAVDLARLANGERRGEGSMGAGPHASKAKGDGVMGGKWWSALGGGGTGHRRLDSGSLPMIRF